VAALLLAACQPGGADDAASPDGGPPREEASEAVAPAANVDAALPDPESTMPYDGIAEDEVLRFVGTEPFWNAEVRGKAIVFTTPEIPDGTVFTVERFAGRGGISFSGMAEHPDLEVTVTALRCSDGMSDRTYPFTVTFADGMETRHGCGWSDRHPFEGPINP
jgi:uncharacterized membrane protein